jgi:hypothetical protein
MKLTNIKCYPTVMITTLQEEAKVYNKKLYQTKKKLTLFIHLWKFANKYQVDSNNIFFFIFVSKIHSFCQVNSVPFRCSAIG